MTQKLNCWQFKNCGREKGGLLADILGVCPVSIEMKYDGANGGIAAGRACWCFKNSNSFHDPSDFGLPKVCHECEFYRRVVFEEAENTRHRFTLTEIPVTEKE